MNSVFTHTVQSIIYDIAAIEYDMIDKFNEFVLYDQADTLKYHAKNQSNNPKFYSLIILNNFKYVVCFDKIEFKMPSHTIRRI